MEPGESFYAPEVILGYSQEGFSRLSWNLHRCIRRHLIRGRYADAVRPITVCSWEAAYFDFNGETIYKLAKEAAELGIDMVVMDDGWFGKRDDDYSGLGDWFVNEDKLGESLGHLIGRINKLGVRFGIWFEPECISEDSELYRKHPDWAFAVPGKDPVRARYQLVLDLSRKEVVDAVYEMMCSVLDQGNIEYIKWDLNRHIEDAFSRGCCDQGRVLHDYMLGLYDLLDRICTRYPHILIEGCSGGGGRFDCGMLYYTPQIWCSDNTDALDRLKIQYGTSFGYPASTVSAHVSAVPNHQTGRVTPMDVRSTVAMAGTFGYELDLAVLTDEEKEAVREDISIYRSFAGLVRAGRYYRLTDPAKEETAAWMFVSEEGDEALCSIVIQDVHGNRPVDMVRLRGLLPGRMYLEEGSGRKYPSDALMELGLPVPFSPGSYRAYRYHFVLQA